MPTINDGSPHLRDFDFALAQLRHAYTHLHAERVKLQRELADGLISPQIKTLERFRQQLSDGFIPCVEVQLRGRIK